MGGIDGENYKLSIRCSQQYLDTHNGIGANTIAKKITARLGGWGGGHPLAAGMTLKPDQVNELPAQIDNIIES
jgi:single-stranded DNA-specific DHH superfamily exonuclease